MQHSRIGFYAHCGRVGRRVLLRELGSEETRLCHVPAGYMGHAGEIWFVRLLPPAGPSFDYHVVFTTPYIIINTSERMLTEYLSRELARVESKGRHGQVDAFTFMMKHGPTANHWNEYILLAYSRYQHDAIFLTGIPEIEKSLPHA